MRIRVLRQHGGHGLHQSVLPLAADDSRNCHNDLLFSDAISPPQLFPHAWVWAEQQGIHATGHGLPGHAGPESCHHAAAGVMRDIGEAVHGIPDAPQDLPGAGEHGPADLMAVRGRDDAAGACSARGWGQ